MYSVFRNLAIIILSAKFFGLVARKFKAPQVVGEIIAGLIIGPCLLNLVHISDTISIFAEIGVVLLMFSTGLGTNLKELIKAGPIATLIAYVGVAVPLAGGTLLYSLFYGFSALGSQEFYRALFIGTIMTATSVSITVATLQELGHLKSFLGTTIVSAAVIDDVIGIVVLTCVLGASSGTGTGLGKVLMNTVLFFATAIGVGAGNGPAYIHRSADVAHALACIARSKSFDYGTVCASEQSIIVEKGMESAVRSEGERQGFFFMDTAQAGALAKLLFRPSGALNPDIVGKPAAKLAEAAGFSVPSGTKVLVAREQEAGPTRPYSMEKLCPVLAFFVMDSEDDVLSKCMEVLRHEGSGHTFAIHATDETVIRRFASQIPVSRFLVNTPAALGGIGATTGLFPALTLGCGAVGGSSSSNNISPLDLINIRRVAWDLGESPMVPQGGAAAGAVNAELVELLTEKILQRLGE